jgi:hypothetical protein
LGRQEVNYFYHLIEYLFHKYFNTASFKAEAGQQLAKANPTAYPPQFTKSKLQGHVPESTPPDNSAM